MEVLFLLNALICFFIFGFLCFKFFNHLKNKFLVSFVSFFSIIGLLYFIFGLISFFWFVGFLSYDNGDFFLFYALVIIFQSLLLFKIIYLFSKTKNLFYFLFFYLLPLFLVFYSIFYALYSAAIISLLLGLLFFLSLTFKNTHYKKIGYIGFAYGVLSLFFLILDFIFDLNLFVFSLTLNCFFLYFVFLFLKTLEVHPPVLEKEENSERPYFLVFLGHFLFIIIFANFVFIGTLAVHEMGHFSASKFYDCNYRKIVYEEGLLSTEISCSNLNDKTLVLLGGILPPFLLGVLLFFVGGRFMTEVGLLIFAFNLIAVSTDLRDLGFSSNLVTVSILFGVLFLVVGMILLVKTRAEEDIYCLK
ncbi:MAG: hypothetical protein OQK82_04370 [Candidatus Pacearchaeota archaeon]|nr:hypothetical protein [Candidatus Pacearchaeota archaeon]